MQFFAFLLALGFPDAPRRGEPPSDHLLRHFHLLLSFASNLARLRRLSLLDLNDLRSINQSILNSIFRLFRIFALKSAHTLISSLSGKKQGSSPTRLPQGTQLSSTLPIHPKRVFFRCDIFATIAGSTRGGTCVDLTAWNYDLPLADRRLGRPRWSGPRSYKTNSAQQQQRGGARLAYTRTRVRRKVSKSKVRLILWNRITEKEKPWSLKQKF